METVPLENQLQKEVVQVPYWTTLAKMGIEENRLQRFGLVNIPVITGRLQEADGSEINWAVLDIPYRGMQLGQLLRSLTPNPQERVVTDVGDLTLPDRAAAARRKLFKGSLDRLFIYLDDIHRNSPILREGYGQFETVSKDWVEALQRNQYDKVFQAIWNTRFIDTSNSDVMEEIAEYVTDNCFADRGSPGFLIYRLLSTPLSQEAFGQFLFQEGMTPQMLTGKWEMLDIYNAIKGVSGKKELVRKFMHSGILDKQALDDLVLQHYATLQDIILVDPVTDGVWQTEASVVNQISPFHIKVTAQSGEVTISLPYRDSMSVSLRPRSTDGAPFNWEVTEYYFDASYADFPSLFPAIAYRVKKIEEKSESGEVTMSEQREFLSPEETQDVLREQLRDEDLPFMIEQADQFLGRMVLAYFSLPEQTKVPETMRLRSQHPLRRPSHAQEFANTLWHFVTRREERPQNPPQVMKETQMLLYFSLRTVAGQLLSRMVQRGSNQVKTPIGLLEDDLVKHMTY